MTRTLTVSGAGFRPYDVVVGRGLLAELGARLAPMARGRTVVIADETVARLHGEAALTSLATVGLSAHIVSVPPGEASKSFEGLADLSEVLRRVDLLRIEDLIPFFPGFVVIDDFKEEICTALEDYSRKIDELKKELCKSFSMKDLGHAKQILGMKITHLTDEEDLFVIKEVH